MAGRGKFATSQRVRYSAEGVRVLCRAGDKFADTPTRVGTFLGMVTERVGRVLWDDRRRPQYLHIDYLETESPPPAHPTPRASSSLSGDTAAAGRAASSDTPSELA